jgi:hypothetical protein
MGKRSRKIVKLIVVMVILVAIFQVSWPHMYPSVVNMNPYPTREYLQIVSVLGPNGLSIITVILGSLYGAWVAFIEP